MIIIICIKPSQTIILNWGTKTQHLYVVSPTNLQPPVYDDKLPWVCFSVVGGLQSKDWVKSHPPSALSPARCRRRYAVESATEIRVFTPTLITYYEIFATRTQGREEMMERNRIRRLQRPWLEFNIYRLLYKQDVWFLKYESLSVSSTNTTLDATISSSSILPTLLAIEGLSFYWAYGTLKPFAILEKLGQRLRNHKSFPLYLRLFWHYMVPFRGVGGSIRRAVGNRGGRRHTQTPTPEQEDGRLRLVFLYWFL